MPGVQDPLHLADSYPGAFSDVQTYLHERIDEVLTNGTTEDVAVYIEGPDITTLATLANRLAGQMGKLSGLDDVQPAPLEFIPRPTSRSTWPPPPSTGCPPVTCAGMPPS
jgi:hypothetical protein